jgi:hypothetical protein
MMSDAEDVCELLERDHDNAVRTFAAAFQQAVALKPKKQGDKADAIDQTVPAKRGRGRPVGSKNKPKGVGAGLSASKTVSQPAHEAATSSAALEAHQDCSDDAEPTTPTAEGEALAVTGDTPEAKRTKSAAHQKRKERAEKKVRVLAEFQAGKDNGMKCLACSHCDRKDRVVRNKLDNLTKHVESDEHKKNKEAYERFKMRGGAVSKMPVICRLS